LISKVPGNAYAASVFLRSRVADYMAKSRTPFGNKHQLLCQRNPVTTAFCEDDTKLKFAKPQTSAPSLNEENRNGLKHVETCFESFLTLITML
jgi:hypothetical protein